MFRRLYILTAWLFCLAAVTLFLANPAPTWVHSTSGDNNFSLG